ncbi:MAG: hypothetical protein R3D29_10955 [Nitratireductor sp.]
MGHRFGHDCVEMDKACFTMDADAGRFLCRDGCRPGTAIVTADHGQTDRGHCGGHEDLQQDFAHYFGKGKGPAPDTLLDQLQLAPTVLSRLGAEIPGTMKAKPFLS